MRKLNKLIAEALSKKDLKLSKTGVHTGGVWEHGDKLYKPIKDLNKIEAEIYKKFKGNPLLLDVDVVKIEGAPYLEMPKLIEVIDTGSTEDYYADVLEGTSHLIHDEIENINNFFSELTRKGYIYNDRLQVGFTNKGDFKIFDFSNAMKKSSQQEALESNLQFLSFFYNDIGFDVLGTIISKVRYILGILRVDLSGRISQVYAKEIGQENLESLKDKNDIDVKGVYYTTNRRGVMLQSNFIQLDFNRYQIVLTDKPLSERDRKSWELKTIVEV